MHSSFFFYHTLFPKAVSDIWRRFSLPAIGYPFAIFAVLDLEYEQFRKQWKAIVAKFQLCPTCFDAEFTTTLIKLAPDFESSTDEEQIAFHSFVQSLLTDIATLAPISTETVENKHGILQTAFHKFRSRAKSIHVAVEESVLDAAVRDHEKLKQKVMEEELPAKLNQSLCKVGLRTRGHYSKPAGLFEKGQRKPLQERLSAAAKKRRRRLSGKQVWPNMELMLG